MRWKSVFGRRKTPEKRFFLQIAQVLQLFFSPLLWAESL
jgi:hypothetical protein